MTTSNHFLIPSQLQSRPRRMSKSVTLRASRSHLVCVWLQLRASAPVLPHTRRTRVCGTHSPAPPLCSLGLQNKTATTTASVKLATHHGLPESRKRRMLKISSSASRPSSLDSGPPSRKRGIRTARPFGGDAHKIRR